MIPLYLCQLCHQQTSEPYICRGCYQDLPVVSQAIPSLLAQQNPDIDQVFCPYLYQPPVSYLIQQLKYHKHYSYARLLAYLFCKKLQEHINLMPSYTARMPEQAIPVPLHRHRLRSRGFNQSFELARFIGKGITQNRKFVQYHLCERTRHTPAQAGLSKKQRQINVKNAFTLTQSLSCQHFVIVDDVFTTGSTAANLAKSLKNMGAQPGTLSKCRYL